MDKLKEICGEVDNLIVIAGLVAIALNALYLPEGAGKDIVNVIAGGLVGYLAKQAKA